MIVDTMTAAEVEREYQRDLTKLRPIVERRIYYLSKKFVRSAKNCFQTTAFYKINQNKYIALYSFDKERGVRAVPWHYVTNTKQPFFLVSFIENDEKYFVKVDAHAILRYMQRTPDYCPNDKEVFVKEAVKVIEDLVLHVRLDANYISPSGLWPLATTKSVDGFVHVKTFIHKSMFTNRQRDIYKQGLHLIKPEEVPFFADSLKEFGVQPDSGNNQPTML